MSVLHAADEAAALAELHRLGCTDGLPVVIPTPERVERMVLAAVEDPTTSLGVMGPLDSATTIEKVAINTVMAGCEPDHMPIVVADAAGAAASRVRPVRGPEHHALDDPARRRQRPAGRGVRHRRRLRRARSRPPRQRLDRAGRPAVPAQHRRGASPGVSDMALLGHGGKFTMCLTEDVAQSPWPACSVDAGFDPFDSVVTVIGVEAPHSVVFVDDADDPDPRSACCGSSPGRSPTRARTTRSSAAGRSPSPSTPITPPCSVGPGCSGPTCSPSCTASPPTGAASCAT